MESAVVEVIRTHSGRLTQSSTYRRIKIGARDVRTLLRENSVHNVKRYVSTASREGFETPEESRHENPRFPYGSKNPVLCVSAISWHTKEKRRRSGQSVATALHRRYRGACHPISRRPTAALQSYGKRAASGRSAADRETRRREPRFDHPRVSERDALSRSSVLTAYFPTQLKNGVQCPKTDDPGSIRMNVGSPVARE